MKVISRRILSLGVSNSLWLSCQTSRWVYAVPHRDHWTGKHLKVDPTFLFSFSRFGHSTSRQLLATIYIWLVTIIRCTLFLRGRYFILNDVTQVCIRRERGYCKIAWSQSTDTDSFKVPSLPGWGLKGKCLHYLLQISRPSTNYRSNTGNTGCQQDSVKIFGGSNYGVEGSCTVPPSTSIPTVDR